MSMVPIAIAGRCSAALIRNAELSTRAPRAVPTRRLSVRRDPGHLIIGSGRRNGSPLTSDMFSGDEMAALCTAMGVTHVVSVADSTIGPWHPAIERTEGLRLVRVCREGEAWAVAGGLYLGGATPLVMIQCTGLFESGDALRNILHDWQLPIFAVIGYRSYLNQETLPGDTCLVFTEPLLDAWRIDYRLITTPAQRHEILAHYIACRDASKPGAALIAEGKA